MALTNLGRVRALGGAGGSPSRSGKSHEILSVVTTDLLVAVDLDSDGTHSAVFASSSIDLMSLDLSASGSACGHSPLVLSGSSHVHPNIPKLGENIFRPGLGGSKVSLGIQGVRPFQLGVEIPQQGVQVRVSGAGVYTWS